MSKTLGSLLVIGAAIAAVTIPGAQAFLAFNILSPLGIAGGTAALSAAGTIITATTIAGGLAALQIGESFLVKSPKPDQTVTAIKTERPPRLSAYGRVKLFGAYVLYETASDGSAVDVWAFHEGAIDAIEGYYLGDDPVTLTADGYVVKGDDGRYGDSDTILVKANLGPTTGTAWADVIAKLPGIWTDKHRGDGVVTGFMISKAVKSKNYQEIYPTGGPNATPLALVVRAQRVFDWRDPAQSPADPTTWAWSENAILHIAHYQLVRNNKSWDRHFAPTLDFWTAAANDADVAMPLKGVQTTLSAKADHGSTSITVADVTGLAAGMSILIGASDNPFHAEARTVGSIAGTVIHFSGDLSYDHPSGSAVNWSASADNPVTEPRYRSCVAHQHAGDGGAPKAVLGALLACCDGWMAPRQDGALVIYSGRYIAPTVSIGPDEIVSYSWEKGVDDESALNDLKVTYESAANNFNTVDADDWTDEDDIVARGALRSSELANQVPSHSQARRLAKRKMAQTMAPFRGTVATTSAGNIVVGKRFINLRLAEGGGTDHEFVVYDGPAEITQLRRNLQTGAVSFSWLAADPNIDAWNPTTEEGDPAPVGDRVAREPLTAPTITSAVATYAENSGAGSTGVRIALDIDAPDRDDLTWFVHWRVQGATLWGPDNTFSDTDPGASVQILTDFVPADAMIEVEAAYQVGDGRISPWSPTATVDTSTAAIAPAPPTEIAATSDVGHSVVSWRNPSSANLSHLKLFRGSSTFGAATAITGDLVGGLGQVMSVDDTGLAAGTYKYWVVAYNATGSASAPDGPATATVT